MPMRWLTWILIILALVPSASAEAESNHYKVAIDAEYAPYEFVDVDGKIKGMLPGLLKAIDQSGDYDDIIRSWLIAPPNWLHVHKQKVVAGIALLSLLIVGFILWNVQLRRTVRRQTQTLHEDHGRLTESEAYRRTLYEQSPIGLALCRMDGSLVDINRAYADILGRSVEETLQLTNWDITPEYYAEDEQLQLKSLEHDGRYGPYEKEYIHQDGHRVNVRLNGVILERNGERFIWSSVEDISKEKMQEVILAEQAEEMQAVIENAPSGILVIDRNANIRNINPSACTLFGYDKAEFIGMPLHALVPDDVRSKHPALFQDEVAGNTHQIMGKTRELRAQRKNGSQFPCAIIVSNFTVKGSRIFSVIVHDLTEEREMQARVEHMQRLESLGVLAGGIAHDFNNILTAIMGNAAMAERKALTNPHDTQQYLANIVSSSEKAAELCKQMLAYSGKGKFVVKAIDLSALVEEVTQLLEISIAKNVVLKYRLTQNLPAVEADVAQIQQVMMNLVINASDAIGEKSGVISITTGVMQADISYLSSTSLDDRLPEGRYIYLEVSDTGCGMDEKTQAKLFEPFFTTKFTGHGLGMSAVLGIVRGHHGAIKVYSEPGRGSTLKILLPISKQQMEAPALATVSSDDWQSSGTVLIVDDEETIRETAAMMLEDMGFDSLSAVDGADGVQIYREHREQIAVVLLDMTMPKMDGKTCFTELRRINKHVKVILSSGYNEQETTSQFAGQGLAGFIQKPYLPEALKEKMQEVMRNIETVNRH